MDKHGFLTISEIRAFEAESDLLEQRSRPGRRCPLQIDHPEQKNDKPVLRRLFVSLIRALLCRQSRGENGTEP